MSDVVDPRKQARAVAATFTSLTAVNVLGLG